MAAEAPNGSNELFTCQTVSNSMCLAKAGRARTIIIFVVALHVKALTFTEIKGNFLILLGVTKYSV